MRLSRYRIDRLGTPGPATAGSRVLLVCLHGFNDLSEALQWDTCFVLPFTGSFCYLESWTDESINRCNIVRQAQLHWRDPMISITSSMSKPGDVPHQPHVSKNKLGRELNWLLWSGFCQQLESSPLPGLRTCLICVRQSETRSMSTAVR